VTSVDDDEEEAAARPVEEMFERTFEKAYAIFDEGRKSRCKYLRRFRECVDLPLNV